MKYSIKIAEEALTLVMDRANKFLRYNRTAIEQIYYICLVSVLFELCRLSLAIPPSGVLTIADHMIDGDDTVTTTTATGNNSVTAPTVEISSMPPPAIIHNNNEEEASTLSKRRRSSSSTASTAATGPIKTVEQLASIIVSEGQVMRGSGKKAGGNNNKIETLAAGDYITYFNQVGNYDTCYECFQNKISFSMSAFPRKKRIH